MNDFIKEDLNTSYFTLKELCEQLSISVATGKNWLKSGRLIPTSTQGNSVLFSHEYTASIIKSIQEDTSLLKRRRNKTHISGNAFYHSYLPAHSANTKLVQKLLTQLSNASLSIKEKDIRILLAECALRLYAKSDYVQADSSCFLSAYFHGDNLWHREPLFIEELLPATSYTKKFITEQEDLLNIPYTYKENEDILGLLYLSLRNLGNRKSNGVYYTPIDTVLQLLHELPQANSTDTILDPCCGTGNFLIQLPSCWSLSQIYGSDIDKLSITLTRINLALKFPDASDKELCHHIRHMDFLLHNSSSQYNYIIGNPPWGSTFSPEEKTELSKNYTCTARNPEAFVLFLEQGIRHLKENGSLSFVLPEAILNVRSHKKIRSFIKEYCNIDSLTYLGNVFDGVQCPSIALQLVKTNHKNNFVGTKVNTPTTCFVIESKRPFTEDSFHLLLTDEEFSVMTKLEACTPSFTLKGNADFALGIVTGNNHKFLANSAEKGMEGILKGSDIRPYHINEPKQYIAFEPKHFQQTAPEALYRAPEKLFYRFISQQLVFAYDDKQQLSLNSCNIIIPHIENINPKYILTILNSRIAQFYYTKKWNSLKVLRSHLEQIPIPVISVKKQHYFIMMADALMNTKDYDKRTLLYEELDCAVSRLYRLTSEEYSIIYNAIKTHPLLRS